MKLIDYNFISNDDAKTIMEAYGYEVAEEEAVEETPEEQVNESEEALNMFVYESNGVVFALSEDVEIIDDVPYIPAHALTDEDITGLDENSTSLLESVEYDDATYNLGDVFEDENSGEIFVALELPE
jgi:hypothetical protein